MEENTLRSVVSEVNLMLDTADYNMISFDSLSRNGFLQLLADCLTKLDALPKLDVERNPNESIAEILDIISSINMPLPNGVKIDEFTEGMIQGKRSILQHALKWILFNKETTKKRAYFSRYLKKIPLPMNLMSDPDIEQILIQYENVIQEFKVTHAENAKYSKMGAETIEMRKFLEKLNHNLSKVVEQINKQKIKLGNIPNSNSLFVSTKAFRNEIQQEKSVETKLGDHNALIAQLESQIKIIKNSFNSRKTLNTDPNEFLKKIQDEVQSNRLIAQERLPQEYEIVKNTADIIKTVVSEPALGDRELENYQKLVDNVQNEIQTIMSETLISSKPADDKLAQFRHHATLIANNKQALANSVMEQKEELNAARAEVTKKEAELQNIIGGTMPQGDDLKRFVSKLRARSNIYKEQRCRLLDVQSETGILIRTKEILLQQNRALTEALKDASCLPKDTPDLRPPVNLSELKNDSKEMAIRISNYVSTNTRMRQELVLLKKDDEELSKTHQQTKEVYESSISNISSEIDKLDVEINEIKSTIKMEEAKWKNTKKAIERKEEILNKSNESATNLASGSKKSLKEILVDKINEQIAMKLKLALKVHHNTKEKENREKQVILWHSTKQLLECKKECEDELN